MKVRALIVVLVVCVLGATSCTQSLRQMDAPECEPTVGTLGGTLVLMAQAVPSTQLVPCIDAYPAGWDFGELFIRDGLARFTLHHDRAGQNAVRVVLTEDCDRNGFEQISSDEDGTDRYERVEQVRPFRASWLYRFPGGCVEYDFRFSEGDSDLLLELAVSLGFVTRDVVREAVEDRYPGDVTL